MVKVIGGIGQTNELAGLIAPRAASNSCELPSTPTASHDSAAPDLAVRRELHRSGEGSTMKRKDAIVVSALAALLVCPVAAHAAKGACSQPASSGSGPSASDCLFILRTAVGSSTCGPACICAPK